MRPGLDFVQARFRSRRVWSTTLAVTAMSLIAAACGSSGGSPGAGGSPSAVDTALPESRPPT